MRLWSYTFMIQQLISYVTLILLLFSIDFLIFIRTKKLLIWKSNRKVANGVWWSTCLVAYLCIFLSFFFQWSNYVTAWLTFIPITFTLGKLMAVPLIAFDLLLSILKKNKLLLIKTNTSINKNLPLISRSDFLIKSGIFIGGTTMMPLIYGFKSNLYNYQVKNIDLVLPNLPTSLDGIKIAQISDIHAGSFFNKKAVENGVNLILAEKPDLIFFTGDLVNDFAHEMNDYLSIFSKLKAPLGTFSILGNHDYGDYHFNRFHFFEKNKMTKQQNLVAIKEIHKTLEWQLLLNESKTILVNKEEIVIIGVENWGANNALNYGDLAKAMMNVKDSTAIKLLLSHDPSHWKAEVVPNFPNIDVTFSGHTHGGQYGIDIPGYHWSPIQYKYKEWSGLYREKQQQLYVNAGFGYLDYPSRVGILPEITIFHLKR
ncbi:MULTISPECIES: metallophosphoesterase [unclassified Sphingobacterium]|uniref:metallophosphoesterase n=1 Tax=unclassified Sphingobacterium TaxID=2609468 RepID=UPI0010CE7BB2|nr:MULTISPECIES: metallophosphoesterase [unclassified Sphingobacterium]MCS3552439.1 putative MPP superfamily phosphohydrolase [Sphingobacterium sp. JUb21]TCR10799.1 hypothetical protein EDF66_101614 [Sphingobacterium sp. JUb20]